MPDNEPENELEPILIGAYSNGPVTLGRDRHRGDRSPKRWVVGYYQRHRLGCLLLLALFIILTALIDRLGLLQDGTSVVRDASYSARHVFGRWPLNWDEAWLGYERFMKSKFPSHDQMVPYWHAVDYEPINERECVIRCRGKNLLGWPTETSVTLKWTEKMERFYSRRAKGRAENQAQQ